MKKVLAVLMALLVVILAAVGVLFWYGSISTQPPIPETAPTVAGVSLFVAGAQWNVPTIGGSYKQGNFEYDMPEPLAIVTLPIEEPLVTVPAGFEGTLVLVRGGERVFAGPAAGAGTQLFAQPGHYTVQATLTVPRQDGQPHGYITYYCEMAVEESGAMPLTAEDEDSMLRAPDGMLMAGNANLQQGDVFSLMAWGLPEGVTPTVQTELGMAVCTPLNDAGDWYCAVPVGNTRAVGEYPVTLTAGENSLETTVTVEKFDFEEQDLTIDVTDPVISEANSAEAYAEYRAKIPPLFNTFDEDIYWESTFIQPAQGRISTHFGTIRYTNGDYANPSHHWGMDIAAAEGTPVLAPNGGRVVLAEYLLNTGNTLVIEHGGGLKSYYFHMNALYVAEGDVVESGQQVGEIGTTGYSTGPHLHFEVRIGNAAISPEMLFLEGAGLYSARVASFDED